MENIKTLTELRQRILLLELEKTNCELRVIQEMENTGEKMSPLNLVKRQINKWAGGSDFSKALIQAGITGVIGFASKKMANTDESHPIKKIIGKLLSFGSKEPAKDEETE
jgi:hypothetical protein